MAEGVTAVVVPPLATLTSFWETVFGPAVGSQANSFQAAARTLLIYGFSLALVRLGNQRLMGRTSSIDVLLTIILGSVLGRGINGSSPLLPTLAASATFVGAHWLLAALTFHWKRVGELLKGRPRTLVAHGRLDQPAMRSTHVTEDDLHEALHLQGTGELSKVATARLERNGNISVVEEEKSKAENAPRVISIQVEAGVQTVRVVLE